MTKICPAAEQQRIDRIDLGQGEDPPPITALLKPSATANARKSAKGT
jgi:hypothetical protein